MGLSLWPETEDALVPAELWERQTTIQADVAYQNDPVGWIRDVLGVPEHTIRWSLNDGYGVHQWDGTPDPLVAVLEGLVNWSNVGVESGTTTGKTFLGACVVLWFLACHPDALVVTVAPKEDQLKLHIWKEIGRLWPKFQRRFPSAIKDSLRIRMRGGNDDTWSAHGFVAGVRAEEVEGSATKAQGFHAEHMLIVFEETPGINPAIMTAFKNTCRAPHNLRMAQGNPDHALDQLHQFCIGPRTEHVIISAYDHPNVVTDDPSLVPGAVSSQGIADALEDAKDDGGEDNAMFQSRVRGISPSQSSDALVRKEWLDRAVDRYRKLATAGALFVGPRAKGVDVANSEKGDKAAIADYQGSALIMLRGFACPDANQLGRVLVMEMQRDDVTQEHVGVDPIGVGAGTVNEAARLNRIVRRLNGAANPIKQAEKTADGQTYEWAPDANAFNNLRSQMHWQFREDLRLDRLAIAPEIVAKYGQQFLLLTYEVKNGKTCVESKDEVKKRTGGKSPDEFDSAVYGNWVRPRANLTKSYPVVPQDKAKQFDYTKRKFVEPHHALDDLERSRGQSLTKAYRVPRPRVGR